jgi:hypothetical protein
VDVQDTARTAEALVPAAKVHGADAVLAEHGSTHDTRLDRDIEIGLVENLERVLGQDACNGHELGMPGATANDFAVFDKDTADRCFVALQGKLGLW